ncbi:MAG: C-terminal target protein [Bacteroidetes bacterium]|nr:C-terminal target protein [Bacteroidota bacterium]
MGLGDLIQRNEPVQISSNQVWKSVSCGLTHTLALTLDGKMWGWGLNGNGQCGLGEISQSNTPLPVDTTHTYVQISCGASHTLAIRSDSTLWSFGFNGNGELGSGYTEDSMYPILIDSISKWVEVSGGFSFSLARKDDGTIWSWGFNGNGQLGLGNTIQQNSPTQIGTNSNWLYINAGSSYCFAINENNELFGWGYNGLGQLGIPVSTTQSSPVQIGNETDWFYISGAKGYAYNGTLYGNHSIGIRSTLNNLCATGANYIGQLGNNTLVATSAFNCNIGSVDVENFSQETHSVTLFPNPSSDMVTVNINKDNYQTYSYRLFDMNGKLVLESKIMEPNFKIDVSTYPKGIYFLLLENGLESYKEKIIVQ